MIAGLRIIVLPAMATLLAAIPGMAQARGELPHDGMGADNTPEIGLGAAAFLPPAGWTLGGNDAAGSSDCDDDYDGDDDEEDGAKSGFSADCNGPGANARYTIVFNAATDYISGIDDLNIRLPDFGFPERSTGIPAKAVTVSAVVNHDGDDGTTPKRVVTAPAANVAVHGERLVITLKTESQGFVDTIAAGDEVTVIIRRSAGITNPTEGGAYPARIGRGHDDDDYDDYDDHYYGRGGSDLPASSDGSAGNAGPDGNRQASSEPPQVFVGIATVNGTMAPPGTTITAWDGDWQVGLTTVGKEGAYVLQVAQALGEITFQIGSVTAEQVYPDWTLGLVITGFNLTGFGPTAGERAACFAARPPGRPVIPALGDSGGELPHVFTGAARVNGQTALPNTPVTAWDGDRQIGYTTTDAGGAFVLKVRRASGRITFQIGDLIADQTHSGWTLGGVTTGFALAASTVLGSGLCPEEAVPVAAAVAVLGSKFVRAFTFDNDHKEWLFYDSGAGQASTLEHFVPGRSYFILVTESAAGVPLNGLHRNLTCVGGNCWNLIVW